MLFNPAAMMVCGGLGALITHRLGGILAVAMIFLGVIIPWFPWFNRLVNHHVKVAYVLAAIAWLLAAGRVGWFWARITM